MAVFQDVLQDSGEGNPSDAFFELANVKSVQYRTLKQKGSKRYLLTLDQTPEVENSTGGVIWETSYYLSLYLEHNQLPLGSHVLEVGSGCGLLGLVLACHKNHVVLTECNETLPVLVRNVEGSASTLTRAGGSASAQLLRWECSEDRSRLHRQDFDVIVGTDVIFDQDKVRPLLETMHSLTHEGTVVFLCFQERCSAAHAEILKFSPVYFSSVQNLSAELSATEGCSGAGDLDCWLLRLSEPIKAHTKKLHFERTEDSLLQPTKKARINPENSPEMFLKEIAKADVVG
jgi:predicted nicotinamide N-methyase